MARRGLWWGLGVTLVAGVVVALVVANPEPNGFTERTLGPEDAGKELPLGLGLRVVPNGTGRLAGSKSAPVVQWAAGTVEVDASALRKLALRTPEAELAVADAALTLSRQDDGTWVEVHRGTAELRCVGDEPQQVGEGARARCAMWTAAGALARARRQLELGDVAGALRVASAGYELAEVGEPVRGELLAVLVAVGDPDAAFDAAALYVAEGYPPRRIDMLRHAARHAYKRGCSAALPYLAPLAAEGGATAGERRVLDRCRSTADGREPGPQASEATQSSD